MASPWRAPAVARGYRRSGPPYGRASTTTAAQPMADPVKPGRPSQPIESPAHPRCDDRLSSGSLGLGVRRAATAHRPAGEGVRQCFIAVHLSEMPYGGVYSKVSAAALVSENKTIATPCSIDSIPTSANQEDHVSMATHAARRIGRMVDNAAAVVGIELLAAAQGIDFHRPARSSASLEQVHAGVRAEVPFYAADRYIAPDIRAAQRWVLSGRWSALVERALPSRAGR